MSGPDPQHRNAEDLVIGAILTDEVEVPGHRHDRQTDGQPTADLEDLARFGGT